MTKIKNLIFDLDNTLYDFSKIWEKSNKLIFEYLKYDSVVSYEEFFRLYKSVNNELLEEVFQGNMKLVELRNKRLMLTLEKLGILLTDEDCRFYYEKQFEFILESIEPDEEINSWINRLSKTYNMILLTNGKSYEQRIFQVKHILVNLKKKHLSMSSRRRT